MTSCRSEIGSEKMTSMRMVFPFLIICFMLLENCYSKQSTSSPCSDPSDCVETSTTEEETTTYSMPTEGATCVSLTDCVHKASSGRLVGFEIKVTNHSGVGSCYKECVGRVYCKSFNYHLETGLCELQSAVPENTTSGNFTNYDGFINILKPNVTYAHPCLKQTCKTDEYCMVSISNQRYCLKECSIPLPRILNGKQEQEGTNNSVFTVGKQITYTCANGSRGPTLVRGRCLFSGEWSSGNCIPNGDFENLNAAWIRINDTFKLTLTAKADTTTSTTTTTTTTTPTTTYVDSTATSLPLETSTLKANSSLVKNITSNDNSSLNGNLTHTDNSSMTDNSTIPNNSSLGNSSLINSNLTSAGNSSANSTSSTPEDLCVPDFSRPRNKSNSEFAYLDTCTVPAGGTAQIVSPIILPGQTVEMSYVYYQRGDGLTHHVYMQANHDNGTVEIRKFAPISGNNGDEWKIQNYKVTPAEASFVLVLEATRKNNATADLAIDDIKVTIL